MKINLFRNSKDFRDYVAGETIFSAGTPGDFMYVIIVGEVEIVLDGVLIDSLTEGDLFGEMALVDNSPRSATAVAASNCRVVPINQKRFEMTVQHNPHFATQVLTIFSQRMRNLMQAVVAND